MTPAVLTLLAAAVRPGTLFKGPAGAVARWIGLTKVADLATVVVLCRVTGCGAGAQRAYAIEDVLSEWRVVTC